MLVSPLEFIAIIRTLMAIFNVRLGYWLRWRQTLRWTLREVQAACVHSWGEPHSLFDQGRKYEWYCHCVRCGRQRNGETAKGPWKLL